MENTAWCWSKKEASIVISMQMNKEQRGPTDQAEEALERASPGSVWLTWTQSC